MLAIARQIPASDSPAEMTPREELLLLILRVLESLDPVLSPEERAEIRRVVAGAPRISLLWRPPRN